MTDARAPIRLGLMAPLSGVVGLYGSEISNAARIAAEEVNEEGGILGQPLELIIIDDGSLPETAVPAATSLIDDQGCVAIIGNLLSNSRIDVAYKVAEPRKIPYLNFSFYEGSISSRYFFHFAALPNQQIDHMIPYMADRFGPKFFFAGSNYEWPRGSIDAAKRSLSRAGGEIVGEQYLPMGADIALIDQLLDAVARSGADVFVPYFAGADQINLLTRFTEAGLKQRMAVVMGHYDEAMVSNLSPAVREGLYSSNTYFMEIDTAQNHRYLQRLATLDNVDGIWPQGNGVLTNFGEGTYLCVKAFAQAVNQAGSVETEALLEALEHVVVEGPQGTVKMEAQSHHATVNSYLAQCRADGTFSIVTNFEPVPPEIPSRYRMARPKNLDKYTETSWGLRRFNQAIAHIELDGSLRYTNNSFRELWNSFGHNLDGSPFSQLWQESSRVEKILGSIPQLGEWSGELTAIVGDEPRNLELSIEGVQDAAGQLSGYTVICLDPETYNAGLSAGRSQQRANNILSIIDIGVIATDASGTIIQTNTNAARLFGYREEEMSGMSVHMLLPPHLREHHAVAVAKFLDSDKNDIPMGNRGEIAGYRKDGSEFPAEASISKFLGADGWVMVATLRDITETKKKQERLRWEATHDPLTRLPNRTLLRERLDNALNRSKRHTHGIAVLFIDLDGFKLINDSFGHDTGDQLLTTIGDRIQDVVRPGDTVGRFGGDEFVVLCEQLEHATEAARVADRINDVLRHPLILNGHEIISTASIGMAYGHGDTHDSESLLRNADAAMYTAKEQGRDSWRLFNESYHEQAKSQLIIANGLRGAIERDEFELVLQPIVSSSKQHIVGAEALLRWHSRDGLISPSEFIPIAEMSGAIMDIGIWVFRRACEIQAKWRQEYNDSPPYLSINLSTRQLGNDRLDRIFASIIEETGAQAERLILEITETALMNDIEHNLEVLNRLAALGMPLAVDDFGTGYSSLSQLSRLPVKHLKIDRSFIADMGEDKNSKTIIEAVISMAHALGMRVVAEGVETIKQYKTLSSLNCDCIQGYLFHKPMKIDKFSAMQTLPA